MKNTINNFFYRVVFTKFWFGTASLAPLPKLLCIKDASETPLVEVGGVEPPSKMVVLKMFSKS